MIILNITRWRARLNRTPRPHRSTSQQPPQHQIALSVWPLTPRPSLNLTRGLFTGWLHFSWDISYCKGYKPVWKHKYVKMTRDKKQRKTMLFISGFLFWLFSMCLCHEVWQCAPFCFWITFQLLPFEEMFHFMLTLRDCSKLTWCVTHRWRTQALVLFLMHSLKLGMT